MILISQIILAAFCLWLITVGILCLIRPEIARIGLSKMGGTPLIHFGEHVLRILVGLACIGFAPETSFSKPFIWAGWFLIVTSLIIMVAPRRWHHAYAKYWAQKLNPAILRGLSVVPIVFGMWLLWKIT